MTNIKALAEQMITTPFASEIKHLMDVLKQDYDIVAEHKTIQL